MDALYSLYELTTWDWASFPDPTTFPKATREIHKVGDLAETKCYL